MTELIICECCSKEFEPDRSVEEARAEADLIWGKETLDKDGIAVICEECFQRGFAAIHAKFTQGQLKN